MRGRCSKKSHELTLVRGALMRKARSVSKRYRQNLCQTDHEHSLITPNLFGAAKGAELEGLQKCGGAAQAASLKYFVVARRSSPSTYLMRNARIGAADIESVLAIHRYFELSRQPQARYSSMMLARNLDFLESFVRGRRGRSVIMPERDLSWHEPSVCWYRSWHRRTAQ